MKNTYSVVTITFCEELDLLRLQARSLALYLPPNQISEIIVIANEPPQMPSGWRDLVLRAYGDLRSRVRFLSVPDLTTMPMRSGWFTQQVLKLLVAKHVTTSHYLILDSKNHLVFPFADYLCRDDKPRMLIHIYRDTHPLRPYLYTALDYFGLQHQQDRFLPTITPYIMPTQHCRDMMHFVSQNEQKPFEQAFLDHRPRLTEFFLFGAYLRTKGQFTDFYTPTGMMCQVIWDNLAANVVKVVEQIEHCERVRVPFFAVHRRAVPELTYDGRRAIAAFWTRRGLFPDYGTAMRFLVNIGRKGNDGRATGVYGAGARGISERN